ncbi:hypothetical protein HYPSUDRAFT_48587 [Hypholoma sublateritium FD-334 SS-4]|uniref:Uncharacterized protein n=1 Tax=Hypholoma sublateritium (strain FD-334 SS-4) TaxID=945553 RepID=A0A0D2KKT3_HYPSF|nr:hypothetical protein HYPSUDRAFT_48587 [Hypholoma sublateritium FD-334 SS-4]
MSPPVYLKVHNVLPRALQDACLPADSTQTAAEMILQRTWAPAERANRRHTPGRVLQSSFDGKDAATHVPQRNGLIGTVLDAYANHHHLILRPDDIWIAVMMQFSFYVKANPDRLRTQFVAHKGKRRLYIDDPEGKFDFALISKAMTAEMHRNVVDKDLKDWILPSFTTTTDSDTIVSAAIMMATLKTYFAYESGITCGIPSITLEGTQKDWLDILRRLDKLDDFGTEPAAWAALLRPVLTQFAAAFDGESGIAFWKRIVSVKALCGANSVSGWIALFGVWADTGRWAGPRLPAQPGADRTAWARSATQHLWV